MGQTYQLEQIIRKVDATAIPKPDDEVVIVFDRMKKKNRHFLGWLKRIFNNSLEYYLVANTNDPRNKVECTGPDHVLKQFDPDVELPVTTSYTAFCKPGDEDKVVLSLNDGATPNAVLNDIIGKLIEEYHTGHENLIRDFILARGKLQDFVDTKVHGLTGLTISSRFFYKKVDLGPFKVSPYSLSISVCDYDEELLLKFSATLGAIQDDIRAVLNAGKLKNVATRLTREIQDYFNGKELSGYYNEIALARPGAMKKELKGVLNSCLATLGREILRYKVEGDVGRLQADEFVEMTCTVTGAKIKEYPEPVSIDNEMQLCLNDIAVFKAAKINNMNGWVEEKLSRIVKQELFIKTYSQLIFEADSIETSITEQLRSEVETIGYSIEHLVSRPDLEEFTLTDSFTIDFSQEFQTRTPEIAGKLQIIITTRINAIEKLKHLIDRQVDIKGLIKDRISQQAQSILHGVTAEEFYIYFELVNESCEKNVNGNTSSKSVRQRIIAVIEQILDKEFHADTDKIAIKQLETAIKKRHDQLIGKIPDFSTEVISLDTAEKIRFSGNFEVRAINAQQPGWDLFCKREYSVEELVNFFEICLAKEFSAMPGDSLKYVGIRDREAMESYLIQKVGEQFINHFGLIIAVTNLQRELTAKEKLEAKAKEKIHQDKMDSLVNESGTITAEQEINNKIILDLKNGQKGEIDKLLQTIHGLTGVEDAEDEIAECRVKLEQMINQPLKSYNQLVAICSPPSESKQNEGFADYISSNNLFPGHIQAGQLVQTNKEQPVLVEKRTEEAK